MPGISHKSFIETHIARQENDLHLHVHFTIADSEIEKYPSKYQIFDTLINICYVTNQLNVSTFLVPRKMMQHSKSEGISIEADGAGCLPPTVGMPHKDNIFLLQMS
jgi:hypothetical protein